MRPKGRIIYGDSERCADLLYATGLFVPDPIIWCSVGDQELIIVSPLEFGRARKESKTGIEVLSYDEARTRFDLKNLKFESQIAGLSRYFGIRRWLVPSDFPYGLVQILKRQKISFYSKRTPFFPDRALKNTDEIEKIEDGVKLAETGLAAAIRTLEESVINGASLHWNSEVLTSEILQGIINSTISHSGGSASHTIVACGEQGADPHNSGSGIISPDQPIIIDIFPRVTRTGYFGDLTRTVVKGQAPDHVTKAFIAVNDARKSAIDKVKSGIDGRQIHRSGMDTLKRHGFKTNVKADPPHGFIHGTGHGLGLEIHERPRINRRKEILKSGNVVTVEPGLYYPEWGGVRIEDVVVVEDWGCRNLTTAPIFLEIE